MDLYPEPIPDGSVLIRGVDGALGSGPLTLSITLLNRGDGVCEASAALGGLSDDTNIQIGMIALGYFFRRLDFHARKGSRVSRHAEYLRSDENFDYYTVDLIATAEKLGIQA